MSTPIPGKPVRGSKSGKPVMALFDLLGRSWALGIIWHLNEGPKTFRQLQEYCETVSPGSMNKRLIELREAFFIERSLEGYRLTALGRQLFGLIEPLGKWSRVWARNFKDYQNEDPLQ